MMVFQTQYNHFKYQIMFFDFFNTVAIFQKYINKILLKKLNIFIFVYLDEILICIKDLRQSYIKAVY